MDERPGARRNLRVLSLCFGLHFSVVATNMGISVLAAIAIRHLPLPRLQRSLSFFRLVRDYSPHDTMCESQERPKTHCQAQRRPL